MKKKKKMSTMKVRYKALGFNRMMSSFNRFSSAEEKSSMCAHVSSRRLEIGALSVLLLQHRVRGRRIIIDLCVYVCGKIHIDSVHMGRAGNALSFVLISEEMFVLLFAVPL